MDKCFNIVDCSFYLYSLVSTTYLTWRLLDKLVHIFWTLIALPMNQIADYLTVIFFVLTAVDFQEVVSAFSNECVGKNRHMKKSILFKRVCVTDIYRDFESNRD